MTNFVGVKQAIKEYGISRSSIYSLIAAKKLTKYAFGNIKKRTFLSREEINSQFKPVEL